MKVLFDIANFKIVQIIVFGSLFLGIYYFTLYDDGSHLRASIADTQTNIDQVSAKVNKKKEEIKNIKIFEKEILNQEDVVKQFLNFIPGSLTFTEVSALLFKEAKLAGINIEVKKDEQVDKKEDSEYRTLKVRLTIRGAFSQILLFLSKLTNQKRMLVVNNIEMRMDRGNGLIGADLLVSAYRYEKQAKKTEDETKKNATE